MEAKMVEKEYRSAVQKAFDAYLPDIERQASGDVGFTPYQRQCVSNALTVINDVAMAGGLKDITAVPPTDLKAMAQRIAVLQLNAFAQPREVYFMTRRAKKNGEYITTVEMGVEGAGYDKMLAEYGRDVAGVYPYWAVREGDEFEYPEYKGVEVTPPVWRPHGTGKYVRVVYPVAFKNGDIRYFIGERADVRTNLVAHISNNLMNETFGIADSMYKATLDQKAQIKAKKADLLALCAGKTLDEILDIPELQGYISPAWSGPSRENMILRKMRNNVVKSIPKDFASMAAMDSADDDREPVDAEFREVTEVPEIHAGKAMGAAAHEVPPQEAEKAVEAPF